MIYLCFSLIGIVLLQAACLVCAAVFFLKREERARQRENALIDRLLKQGHVAPLEIQRENVVKLPDPEIQPASWIDESFMVDEIKEELEQVYPEVARMSHSEARARYAHDWAHVQKRLQAERTPLRAE